MLSITKAKASSASVKLQSLEIDLVQVDEMGVERSSFNGYRRATGGAPQSCRAHKAVVEVWSSKAEHQTDPNSRTAHVGGTSVISAMVRLIGRDTVLPTDAEIEELVASFDFSGSEMTEAQVRAEARAGLTQDVGDEIEICVFKAGWGLDRRAKRPDLPTFCLGSLPATLHRGSADRSEIRDINWAARDRLLEDLRLVMSGTGDAEDDAAIKAVIDMLPFWEPRDEAPAAQPAKRELGSQPNIVQREEVVLEL